jgi:hypothetical protein
MIGVITSPRATFAEIVRVPQPYLVLLVVIVVMSIASALPQFTESGRQAVLDAQLGAAGEMPPEAVERMQAFAPFIPYVTLVMTFIFVTIMTLIATALYWAIFNIVLGGTATFKQALAVVAHASVIGALGLVVALPFMMSSPTMNMGGPFNLGALAPTLDEGSRLARFLGNVSVFSLWGTFVTAIGLSVLYRRGTTGIFIALLAVTLGLTFAFTSIGMMFGG